MCYHYTGIILLIYKATIPYRDINNPKDLVSLEIEIDIPEQYIGNCKKRYVMNHARFNLLSKDIIIRINDIILETLN